jgi:hypothetical protein
MDKIKGVEIDPVREKLIEILRVPIYPHLDADPAEVVADYLLDNGVTIQKWIPVTERLPGVASTHKTPWDNYSESIRVLCACLQADGKRMVKEGYCKVYEGYEANPHWKIPGTIHSVTHWMYLPEPPKGE